MKSKLEQLTAMETRVRRMRFIAGHRQLRLNASKNLLAKMETRLQRMKSRMLEVERREKTIALPTAGRGGYRGGGRVSEYHSRLLGMALFLICVHLCSSVAAAQFSPPPDPGSPDPKNALLTRAVRMAVSDQPAAVTKPKTNASVWLKWSAGDAEQTLVSYSNQTAYSVGLADIVSVTGLVAGSTNTFAVTNRSAASNPSAGIVAGASNLATGIATRGTNRINTVGTITIYAADRIPGRTNWLLTSTNLLTWTRAVNLGTNAGAYTFLVTNGATSAMFYQTLTE